MFKLRKLGFLALGFLFLLSLVACNSDEKASNGLNASGTSQTGNPEKYPDVTFAELGTQKDMRFSSIQIDTSKTKTTFYVGEEFTYEGLVVNINYLVFENGTRVGSETVATTDYSIDYSEVDTNHVGTYPVIISFRDGTIIQKQTYNVEVKTALFETQTNFSYAAGLTIGFNATYSNNKLVKTIYVNDDYTFAVNHLTYTLVNKTIDANGKETLTTRALSTRGEITAECVSTDLDTTKVGTYTIKITYDAGKKKIGDTYYDNKVTSFVLVDVINPVTSFEKVSTNDTTIQSTADILDLSNWQFKITRHIDVGEEIVNYSNDLFVLSGINQFVTGDQEVTVTFRERTESGEFLNIKIPVTITESPTHNILVFKDLTYKMTPKYNEETGALTGYDEAYTAEEKSGRVALDPDGILFGCNFTREYKIREGEGLSFSIRTKIEKSPAYFEINMATAGKIVLYISSTGDGIRPFTVNNADGDTVFEDNMTIKDTPQRFEFECAAGVYKLSCEATLYVNGVIVATEKPAA